MESMIRHEVFPTLLGEFRYDNQPAFKDIFMQHYEKYGKYLDTGLFVTGEAEGVNRLHHEPAFADFYSWIGKCVIEYLTALNLNLDNFHIILAKSWLSFCEYKFGGSVPPHNHADHHLSFVYYVDSPEGCDTINFRDNRVPMNEPFYGSFDHNLGKPPNTFGPNKYNDPGYYLHPIDGQLIIFPSKLDHFTMKLGEYEGYRRCIAGDFLLVYKDVNNHNPFGMYREQYWKFYT